MNWTNRVCNLLYKPPRRHQITTISTGIIITRILQDDKSFPFSLSLKKRKEKKEKDDYCLVQDTRRDSLWVLARAWSWEKLSCYAASYCVVVPPCHTAQTREPLGSTRWDFSSSSSSSSFFDGYLSYPSHTRTRSLSLCPSLSPYSIFNFQIRTYTHS